LRQPLETPYVNGGSDGEGFLMKFSPQLLKTTNVLSMKLSSISKETLESHMKKLKRA